MSDVRETTEKDLSYVLVSICVSVHDHSVRSQCIRDRSPRPIEYSPLNA